MSLLRRLSIQKKLLFSMGLCLLVDQRRFLPGKLGELSPRLCDLLGGLCE